jgi:two-component SAPR family response regulator
MARTGPVIIIEDDVDDEAILKEVLAELKVNNKVVCFEISSDAWEYLKTTNEKPLIIFCDINLRQQNGLEFKKQIDADEHLRKKSIPFVFYSTSVKQDQVDEAYIKMTTQGFFKKPSTYEEIKKLIKVVLDYWLRCKHPNE